MADRLGATARMPKTRGRCQLCCECNRDLQMLFIGDFSGWACDECRNQLRKSQERQYCGTLEHTEPGE